MNGYEAFQTADVLDPNKLASLSQLAQLQLAEEKEVARLEGELAAAKDRLNDVAERRIPTIMEEVGLEKFKTTEGLVIDVKESLRCSVPAVRKQEAMKWLDDHGHSAIVKRTILVDFAQEDEATAKVLEQLCANTFPNTKHDRNVHSSTLKAHIKQMLAKGEAVPMDLFGVFPQKRAKITVKT